MPASIKQLDALHQLLCDHLTDRIQNGETSVDKKGNVITTKCNASVLTATIKLLKEEGITADNDDEAAADAETEDLAQQVRDLAREEDDA